MTRTAIDAGSYAKTAGEEPLPGYRLMEPLGRGGFGEVWKCEAPGGLHKAVKFVAGDQDDSRREDTSLKQEYEAFQQIKAIRHPFLLTLERVELIRGELVMVMELADGHMLDRFDECREAELSGVPRQELIRYLADAAEALDFLSSKYSLQHLDIKPANLFLVGDHVKVGDYGLVSRFEKTPSQTKNRPTRGLTPRYVAPEVVEGNVDHRSDQYSLALVYQEMLTGTFPFRGKSPAQMLLLHATAPPDLSWLPEGDRGVVARALAKKPQDRYTSCLEFISALASLGEHTSSAPPVLASGAIRRLAKSRSISAPSARSADYPTPRSADYATPRNPLGTAPHAHPTGMPSLVSQSPTAPQLRAQKPPEDEAEEEGMVELVTTPGPVPTVPASQLSDRHNSPAADAVTQLDRIWSVVPVVRLTGISDGPPQVPAATDLASAVVKTAAGITLPRFAGDPVRGLDGSWISRILLKPVAGVVRLKLQSLAEQWKAEFTEEAADRIAIRIAAPSGSWLKWSNKKAGLELIVKLPAQGQFIGEAELTGRLFGNPDSDFARSAEELFPQMMDQARRQLQNTDDRRKSPRIPATFPIRVFPISSDGIVYMPLAGRCCDVSAEGVRLVAVGPVETRYAFVAFEQVPAATGNGILTRILRSRPVEAGIEIAGRYRMDL